MPLPTPEATLDAYAEAMAIASHGAMPQLVANTRDQISVMVLANTQPDGLQTMIAAALARLICEHGHPSWLTFAAETWFTLTPVDAPHPANGALEERAGAGDDTVAEAVILLGVAANGETWNGIRPFHRSPLGVVWDGPLDVEWAADGGILEILQRATR